MLARLQQDGLVDSQWEDGSTGARDRLCRPQRRRQPRYLVEAFMSKSCRGLSLVGAPAVTNLLTKALSTLVRPERMRKGIGNPVTGLRL
jgi:hypothetical protein